MCKEKSIREPLGKHKNSSQEHSLVNEFWKMKMNTALDSALQNDADYQLAEKNRLEKILKIENLSLSAKQLEVVYNAISSCNEKNSVYGRVAYTLGFKDAANLLKDF